MPSINTDTILFTIKGEVYLFFLERENEGRY
jgi:hypothetical protein